MAIFRKINVNFWEDEKVVDDFTPEDRFFMLYLMTNPHTNQIGCYKITIKQMEFETGYNKETIEKLLNRFEKIHKVIKYSNETKEILILNWYKYNWSNSPKIIACMDKEFKTIKNKGFRYCIDRLCIEYGYNMHTETQEEEEEEKEKEQEEEKISKKKIDELFAVFYTAYPRKTGKAEARKKYEVALKRASAEKILNGVKQYCKEINANKTEKQFIKHPSTWLNQQCWLDYDDIIETEVVDFEQKMRDECYKRMLKEGQITEDEFNKYWENRGKEVVWQ